VAEFQVSLGDLAVGWTKLFVNKGSYLLEGQMVMLKISSFAPQTLVKDDNLLRRVTAFFRTSATLSTDGKMVVRTQQLGRRQGAPAVSLKALSRKMLGQNSPLPHI
jgi:hypothetical protein